MTINIHENILNIYSEQMELIKTVTDKTYILYPSEGKILRNKLTGFTTDSYVGVGSNDDIKNYEEIDKES